LVKEHIKRRSGGENRAWHLWRGKKAKTVTTEREFMDLEKSRASILH